MTAVGYALSSEEHGPRDLVRNARRAEDAGFTFALISDHFHPWIERHPHSPFVWGVLGAIAEATDRLVVGTGVTCPTMRIHPAIVAHAAATAADLMPGRFFLGVGTGENLNEHILGQAWPEWDVRAEMLEEAVEVIRALWSGEVVSRRGAFYRVQNAKLYSLPESLPPIRVAASGERMAREAARYADGLISTSPDKALLDAYQDAGGRGPLIGQMSVCWAETEAKARKTAFEWWPIAALHGEVSQELPNPAQFTDLAKSVTEDQVAEAILCTPDADRVLERIQEYADAGYDHVYLHQIGPEQADFLDFASRDVLPKVGKVTAPALA
ncbi:MAG TPA: TIGR03557 family F420-dependent LLM class oxidoreductase [Candidatus Limnocylindrales bacterium]|jgi:G6PDH family F420-dependent oxidoreductase